MTDEQLMIGTNKIRTQKDGTKFKIKDYITHKQSSDTNKYFSIEELDFFNSKDQEKHGDIRIRYGKNSNGKFRGTRGSPIFHRNDLILLLEKAKKKHLI